MGRKRCGSAAGVRFYHDEPSAATANAVRRYLPWKLQGAASPRNSHPRRRVPELTADYAYNCILEFMLGRQAIGQIACTTAASAILQCHLVFTPVLLKLCNDFSIMCRTAQICRPDFSFSQSGYHNLQPASRKGSLSSTSMYKSRRNPATIVFLNVPTWKRDGDDHCHDILNVTA
ncbi:hypothetical protein GE21DRAFT_1136686 [Neurospora crassa]|nr:hypothetical protein GE21DRAFT_1136686 [Neurospora crassa]